MKTIRKRQIEFFGHVMRKEGLEELMLTGRVNGKRSRGRQRLTYLESLSKWMTEQVDETEKSQVARLKFLRKAKDRDNGRQRFVDNIAHRERDCVLHSDWLNSLPASSLLCVNYVTV